MPLNILAIEAYQEWDPYGLYALAMGGIGCRLYLTSISPVSAWYMKRWSRAPLPCLVQYLLDDWLHGRVHSWRYATKRDLGRDWSILRGGDGDNLLFGLSSVSVLCSVSRPAARWFMSSQISSTVSSLFQPTQARQQLRHISVSGRTLVPLS